MDWLAWLDKYGSLARRELPEIQRPVGYVVIGRDRSWPEAHHERLRQRNLVFTGRQDVLDQLAASLQPGQTAAVVQPQAMHGLGGVGKTQLALEFAHRHRGDYDLIWWIAAEQPAAIPGQLAALARRLNIPEAARQAETVQLLWDELRQRDRWRVGSLATRCTFPIRSAVREPFALHAFYDLGETANVIDP